MPSKKRKYNARFPAGRIKKIMQTDEEVGKVAQAVPIIISRTLELFVESLLKKSMEVTVSRNAKTLSPSHVKQCILSEARFDFLKDLVRNVPDVSAAEEREQSLQTPGTPPSEIRYPEAAIPPPSRSSPHSQPSTSRAQQSSHSVRGRRPASVSSMSSEQPRSSPIVQYREEHNGRRTDPSNQPEDLSKRRVPNFYQETLPDSSDASQESVSNHSSVIQVNPAYAPKPIEQLSEEPKPKIDLNQPLYRIDLTRVPLQSSTSFESALPPRPPLNFDFSRNPLRADVKYGGMDLASGPPRDNVKYSGMDLASGPPRDAPSRDGPSRDAPPRAQAAPGQRSTSRPQPPPLVPISQLLKPMNLDEDYDA